MSFSRIHIEAILLKTDLIWASINKIKKSLEFKSCRSWKVQVEISSWRGASAHSWSLLETLETPLIRLSVFDEEWYVLEAPREESYCWKILKLLDLT